MGVNAILIDTHTFVWALYKSNDLSATAREAIESAGEVYVPPCSFHEIAMKHRAGKWPLPDADVRLLPQLLSRQGGLVAPYTAAMAMLAGALDWEHRDPFDRMIAATAIEMACPLVSKDAAFDGLDETMGWKERIW